MMWDNRPIPGDNPLESIAEGLGTSQSSSPTPITFDSVVGDGPNLHGDGRKQLVRGNTVSSTIHSTYKYYELFKTQSGLV